MQLFQNVDRHVINGDARTMSPNDFPHKYGVIVADPPWSYRVAHGEGVAEDEYDLLSHEDLKAMPVEQLAAPDCALFLWGTWPKLDEVLEVMVAWGFSYVTGFPWVKTKGNGMSLNYGVGYWFRGVSEYVLVGRRGNVPPPKSEGFMGILSPNLKHSRKPDSIYEVAEALPGPYLELFARRSRLGWTSFGNQVDTNE